MGREEVVIALARYEEALSCLKSEQPQPSPSEILDILIARDTVAEILKNKTRVSREDLTRVLKLDSFLVQESDAIATFGQFKQWRKSFDPPTECWWWFIEPMEQVHPRARYHWVFNLVTLISLTGVTAYMTTFLQLFSAGGGYSLFESFGIIGQGGLLLTTFGTLHRDGQQQIQKILKRLNISPHYHSEVTCGISLLLLLGSFGVYNSLPNISKLYQKEARKFYENGLLAESKKSYERSTLLLRDENNREQTTLKVENQVELGLIYESLGNYNDAIQTYLNAIEQGSDIVMSIVAMGRISRAYLFGENNMDLAESFVRMGISKANNILEEKIDKEEISSSNSAVPNGLNSEQYRRYQSLYLVPPNNSEDEKLIQLIQDFQALLPELHRHLGWVSIEQEKYAEAIAELQMAEQLEQDFNEVAKTEASSEEEPKQIYGAGLSACLLAYSLEKSKTNAELQQKFEQQCTTQTVYPETIGEYQWFLRKKPELVKSFDTKYIVEGKRNESQ